MSNERLPIYSYFLRVLELTLALASALARFAWRHLRGQATQGPELVREFFEKLGGSFIKFGQILSLQIDSLPREYCDALLSLLDRVPPFPPDEVERVFMESLRASPRDLYQSFDYQPIASASIGQAHRATLKDGTAAAVKVQRPGIRAVFERDNLLLRVGVRFILFFRIRSLYFMRDPGRELSPWTLEELHYQREGSYA